MAEDPNDYEELPEPGAASAPTPENTAAWRARQAAAPAPNAPTGNLEALPAALGDVRDIARGKVHYDTYNAPPLQPQPQRANPQDFGNPSDWEEVNQGNPADIAKEQARSPNDLNQAAYQARLARAVSPEHFASVAAQPIDQSRLSPEAQAQYAEQQAGLGQQAFNAGMPATYVGNGVTVAPQETSAAMNAARQSEQTLANVGEAVAEHMGAKRPEFFEQGNRIANPATGGISGAAGEIIPQIAAVYASGPAAPLTAAALSAMELESQWKQQAAAGEPPSRQQMIKDVATLYAQNAIAALLPTGTLPGSNKEVPLNTRGSVEDWAQAAPQGAHGPQQPMFDEAAEARAQNPHPTAPGFTEEKPPETAAPATVPNSKEGGLLTGEQLQKSETPETPSSKPTWLDEATEAARQETNQKAVEGHPDTYKQQFSDWLFGRRMANEAVADWQYHTKIAAARMEQYHAAAPNSSSPEGIKFIDELEQTGHTSAPGMEGYDDLHARLNKEAKDAATAAGTDTSPWGASWFKRLFRPTDGTPPARAARGLAGSEGYLKARTQPTYADAIVAAKANGYEPAYPNSLDMQLAGISEVHRSAALGKQVQTALSEGNAIRLKPGEAPPENWLTAGHLLGANGENIAMPARAVNAMQNIVDRSIGDVGKIWQTATRLRYTMDRMLLYRAIFGGLGDTLSTTSRNRFSNLVSGWRLAHHLDDLDGPEFDTVRPIIQEACEKAGYMTGKLFRNPGDLAKRSNGAKVFDAVVGSVPNAINAHVTEPIRAASLLNMADEVVNHPEWTPAYKQDFMRKSVESVNRLVGGEHNMSALPPAIENLLMAMPYRMYKTSAIRQGVAAANEIFHGAPSIATRKLLGSLTVNAGINAVAQMVMTKVNTGHVIYPTSPQDWIQPQTGEVNPDGSMKRETPLSTFAPGITAGYEMARGKPGQAVAGFVDPAIQAAAEAINGYDAQGHPLSMADRVLRIPKSFFFTPNLRNPETGKLDPAYFAGQLASPYRQAPKTTERSTAQNILVDAGFKGGGNTELPDEAVKWTRWNTLAETPELLDQNRDTILNEMQADPHIGPTEIGQAIERWSLPGGVFKSAMNNRVGPDALRSAYGAASDTEKPEIARAVGERLSNKNWENMSQADRDDWLSLRDEILH